MLTTDTFESNAPLYEGVLDDASPHHHTDTVEVRFSPYKERVVGEMLYRALTRCEISVSVTEEVQTDGCSRIEELEQLVDAIKHRA